MRHFLIAVRQVAALAAILLFGTTPATAQLTPDPVVVRSISPDPVVVGRWATVLGSGFGAPGSLEIDLVTQSGPPRPVVRLGASHVRAWSDGRIELALPITREGRYGLRLNARPEAGGGGSGPVALDRSGGISFDAELPRPTIRGYSSTSVCPGQPLAIHGSDFTAFRGAFAILWEKTGRPAGVTISEDRILHWADNEIRFTVPTDLPGYIAPGDGFQIRLARRLERALGPVAAGPRGRIPASCGSDGAVSGPSLTPSERRALGRNASPGRELAPSPAWSGALGSALVFKLAPMQGRARIGDALVFGGSFEAPDALAKALRSDPAQMEWTIRRNGSPVATGLLDLRSRRTPWLHRVKAERAGTYQLELRLLHAPTGTTFDPDLSAARVTVPTTLNRNVDPKTLQKQPHRTLPGPRRLEPIAP